ncbi:MAG: hypothetical protein A2Y25_02190 [Candidatus Melainabacteria bacterium GWF2_37_15]|nr:MAG: hypothetical protein A2Y25_02190 [Candidatus Melainabacteria bacterium GWF2_37_15]
MDINYIHNWIKHRLNEERYLHSLGAEETARELAVQFSVDVEKAALAALIHDNAKCIPYEDVLQIIKENNFSIDENIKSNKKVVHAYLGALLAEKELNIKDEDVLNAVRFHTTGRPNMTMLEKVVFLADKIEANTRELDFREEVLNILNKTGNIDEAVMLCIGRTIHSLVDRKLMINPITIEVWNYYL